MTVPTSLVLSEVSLTALHFIYQYRYLSVAQVACVTGLRPKSTSEMLLRLERQKLLGFFGNTGIRGYGKTPKVYFLTKTGHRILSEEGACLGLETGTYKDVSVSSRWSPQMYHRLATLDVMLSLERVSQGLIGYSIPAKFLEYRREKKGEQWIGETTDFVSDTHTSENRIVPDAGFILENNQSANRALFLIEVDRGTERQATSISDAVPQSFRHKIEQYDRYLKGGKFKEKYSAWGKFSYFVLLVVTNSEGRLENMRRNLSDLKKEHHQFYRFSIQETVVENFFHGMWRGRSIDDHQNYKLIKGGDGK